MTQPTARLSCDMVNSDLLRILRCPETHQRLTLADTALVAQINETIASGHTRNRAGQPVTGKIHSALVREDGKFLYPVRDGIPVMLIDEAILLRINA